MKTSVINSLDRLYSLNQKIKDLAEEGHRCRLLEACQPVFDDLQANNIKESFSVSLLVFGDEFIQYEYGVSWEQLKRALQR